MNIAIIGAGIAGLLPAYYLAKEGHHVTIFEQDDYPAMRCSYANGGQISVSNSEVWTSWSNIFKGIKWMLKKDAPLLIRPSLDFDKALWLCKFLYHTANNDSARRTVETIKLGIESRYLYNELISDENLKFDQSKCGIMHIYKNQKYFDNALRLTELYESNGCEWRDVSSSYGDIEPLLKNSKDIIGAIWTPSDWTGDIHKFCVKLYRILEHKYKVQFVFNFKIDSVNDLNLFEKIIIANGTGAVELAKSIGERLPIYPVKGYSVTINNEHTSYFYSLPKVSILDDEAKIVCSTLGNRLRVAGTAEFAGENYDIRRDRIIPLLNWVKKNFPNVDRHNYTQWACLRPMTPNMMPIVRQSRMPNVYYHVGHGHLGWTVSPATSQQLIKIIKEI